MSLNIRESLFKSDYSLMDWEQRTNSPLPPPVQKQFKYYLS